MLPRRLGTTPTESSPWRRLQLRARGAIENPMLPAAHPDPYTEGELDTRLGAQAYRLYRAPRGKRAAVWVGGVGGGWDTPARDLYPKLGAALTADGVSSLRLRFRNPQSLADAVADVRAGINFLAAIGIDEIAVIGHSFGGAVVIRAAALEPRLRTVVTLATQSYGAEPAAQLPAGCSLLLIHGLADRVLPWQSSEYVHAMAAEPKRVIYIADAGHGLDEAAPEVTRLVRAWLIDALAARTR